MTSIEAFSTAWWSKDEMTLAAELSASYHQPQLFAKSLVAWQSTLLGLPCRAMVGQGYDLYHDCIERHLGKQRPAFSLVTTQGCHSWTFEDIHLQASALAAQWHQQGMTAGTCIALVMPMGAPFVISLMAALKLGLRYSYLPTDSPLLAPSRLTEALKTLEIGYVITTETVSRWLKTDVQVVLYQEKLPEAALYHPSYEYVAAAPLQLAWRSISQPPSVWCTLSVEATYLTALRDGMLLLGLRPGQRWCYPFSCSLREQPSSLLAALLCGATTLYIDAVTLLRQPTLLQAHPVEVLGLGPYLPTTWQDLALPHRQLQLWHRPPHCDGIAWDLLAAHHHLGRIPCSQLLFDSSYGGTIFASKPTLQYPTLPCRPSPGAHWSLVPLHADMQPDATYGAVHFDAKQDGNFVVTNSPQGWLLSGCLHPHRRGATMPMALIEQSLRLHLSFVQHAVLLAYPKPFDALAWHYTLLIFIHPSAKESLPHQREPWRTAVMDHISQHVGAAFIPDQIAFYPLYPPTQEGLLDRTACSLQHTAKILDRKKEIPLYQHLSALRYHLQPEQTV